MGLTNNTIKLFKSLKHKKFRQKYNIFIAEGDKLCRDILGSALEIEGIYSTADWAHEHAALLKQHSGKVQIVDLPSLKKLSFLKTPNQVTMLVSIPRHQIGKELFETGLHLYLDGIQDPGNLGTMVRIADWFGVSSMICSPDSADLYNPKVVQAGMGSIGRIPVIRQDLRDILGYFPREFKIVACVLEGASLFDQKLQGPSMVVIGNEGSGIRQDILDHCTNKVSIPRSRKSRADSLNAAVAAGIVCAQFRA